MEREGRELRRRVIKKEGDEEKGWAKERYEQERRRPGEKGYEGRRGGKGIKADRRGRKGSFYILLES